jgi:hypothetical protein
MPLYKPIYDLHQPPCADINEALMELDAIIYTLDNGEMNDNERLTLSNKCDSLSKFIELKCPSK